LETKGHEIMAMTHKLLPVVGIQYHPEAVLTQFGQEIIGNWIRHYRIGLKKHLSV